MGRLTIPSKKPSLQSLAEQKLDDLEEYALHSSTLRKLASWINKSEMYNLLFKRINKIRDHKLLEEIKKNPVPNHVAIIMDGNRRFAQSIGLEPQAGHQLGSNKLENMLDWCLELGIQVLTVYAFSTENFKRSKQEVQQLMDLCKEEIEKAKQDSRIHRNEVRINIIGNIDSLPKETRESAKEIMEKTKHYEQHIFNIALAYGGRQEIIHAIQQIAEAVENNELSIHEIEEKTVSSYLYTNGIPDPDLVLRTSGEERISNFLLWQLAYSELYFSDVYWPAFRKRDFLRAIKTYQKRKRRYGQ